MRVDLQLGSAAAGRPPARPGITAAARCSTTLLADAPAKEHRRVGDGEFPKQALGAQRAHPCKPLRTPLLLLPVTDRG